MEHHNLVDSVDKLGLKEAFYLLHDLALHLIIALLFTLCRPKSQIFGIYDALRSRIGSHDQYGILKAYLTALGICDMPVIQYLQKHIEHIRMGFLYLIKKNYRIRIPANLLRELSALLEPHITRRGTDHLRHGMAFHIF